ncbi:N-acetylglutamate synthase, CG3035 family [Mycolicibacterium holsaticum]|uniref:N-acetylglutamate synthase, CG3035 family n=1 Tax=Mycolicibacterium holsaticum TaxID=152142 RepID=UPI001C7CE374|nr:GNAT family N-acetyltransferase [Mycolicibacterium holsaticum]MDA4109986.1 N-acetyltransferase GCN5 [Mycolicibacterium holsaticum DSM 44478 = JCM 12374]QZA12093.1 GNAT family N-acetyltransferase [Mycolicibacterium holsaticum DSM 44478 = JCM 12374]UNC10421.1 GNAT family N-acetyltransferase [Mycolicibacterium holsaticum DSM 44478 = JCM 12374]
MQVPAVGSRVVIRYRLPAGSEPPLSDVVGHLLEAGRTLTVRTKAGDVVAVAADDVVVLRELPAATVRTADIRKLEHAAALAWPGVEQRWVEGWFLRAAGGHTRRGNSAVPLGFDATASALPDIVEWYSSRGLTPWLSIPDRLFKLADAAPHLETVVMARELGAAEVRDATVLLAPAPGDEWLRRYERDVPVEVLTSVVDGEAVFATAPGAAVARAAVTTTLDLSRWVGISALRVTDAARRRGHARRLCSTLLSWGLDHGASHAYAQVLIDNAPARRLFESMGFTEHHRSRYMRADALHLGADR